MWLCGVRPPRSQGYDVHGYSGAPPAMYLDFRGPPKQARLNR